MSEMEEQWERHRRSLEESIEIYDNTTDTSQEIRNQLIQKILPAVLAADYTISDRTDPDVYASQARMLSEFRQLINDRDTADRNNVQIKLKQKDQDIQQNNTFNVAEFLNNISSNFMIQNNQPTEINEELLEEKAKEKECIVLDTEILMEHTPLPEKIEIE